MSYLFFSGMLSHLTVYPGNRVNPTTC